MHSVASWAYSVLYFAYPSALTLDTQTNLAHSSVFIEKKKNPAKLHSHFYRFVQARPKTYGSRDLQEPIQAASRGGNGFSECRAFSAWIHMQLCTVLLKPTQNNKDAALRHTTCEMTLVLKQFQFRATSDCIRLLSPPLCVTDYCGGNKHF